MHEIRSHLRAKADLVLSQVKNALKPLGNSWGIDKDQRNAALLQLFGGTSGEQKTEERLQAFLDDSSASVLTCSDLVILGAINSQSDKIEIDLEATANWYYDAELYDVEVTSDEPLAKQVATFEVVVYDEGVLEIQASLSLDVTAHFNADFQAWDGVDGEYLPMGSASLERTEPLELAVILTMAFANGTAHVESVELLPLRTTMDFGEIGPDWMSDPDPDPEEEDAGVDGA